MKKYILAFFLTIAFIGISYCYAEDICYQNDNILEYKSKLKDVRDNINLDVLDEISSKMDVILENLTFECAEKLMAKGVDEELFQAGFPTLITSLTPEVVIDSLENMLLGGDHKYFVRDNERILNFLRNNIEERNKKILMRQIYDLDKWRQIHDFVLAAKFSFEDNSNLEEMRIQAKRAYNPLNFALYLPIWQGEERRKHFAQLCLELGCTLGSSQECSPETTDNSWEIKAQYFANEGNLLKAIYECNIFKDSRNILDEINLFSSAYFMNPALDFRRMGILNSNCDFDKQLKYIESQGLDEADNCDAIN